MKQSHRAILTMHPTIEMLVAKRKELKVTQQELADDLDLSQQTIALFEQGKDCLLSTYVRYAEALGLEVELKGTKCQQ